MESLKKYLMKKICFSDVIVKNRSRIKKRILKVLAKKLEMKV